MDINAVILTMIAELKSEVLDLRAENEALRAQVAPPEEGEADVPRV